MPYPRCALAIVLILLLHTASYAQQPSVRWFAAERWLEKLSAT